MGFGVWGLGFGFGVWGLGFGVWGLGFGVWGLGFGVWGLGFGVWGLGFGVWGLGFGVWGLGFGVWGLGFGVWGLGFGVWGLGWLGFTRFRVCRGVGFRICRVFVCRASGFLGFKNGLKAQEGLQLRARVYSGLGFREKGGGGRRLSGRCAFNIPVSRLRFRVGLDIRIDSCTGGVNRACAA